MKRLGIQDKAIKVVEGCANSVEGQWALHDLGVETTILQPPPTFIPQINFNGVNKVLNIKDISIQICNFTFKLYSSSGQQTTMAGRFC